MVDEACLVAHAVAVDHHAAVQVQAVMVTMVVVLLNHPVPKEQHKGEVICDLPAADKSKWGVIKALQEF